MAATYSSLVGVQVGGKYEIRRVLGAGGMGVVCEAVHVDLGKRVAIKLIDKSMKESEAIVARFRREARALGQIDSEHIVDVFDVGADSRVGLYMVMEYLTGEDLQERLERDRKIDTRTMVMIGHQVARALAKAHAAGVVHRDLKPANVYITKRDTGALLVKLLDFGISKIIDEVPGNARITGQGAPIGTPLYMSPEQAEGKDDVDGRADIWSFGAVMYEALAGESAFKDRGSYHNTIIGILTSQPPPLHQIAPWVPASLAAVVDAMIVHDREKRIADAATVTKRLFECFPSVLPDGTGQHTAIILAKSEADVDPAGDTEVFTSRPNPTPSSAPGRNSRPPLARDSTTTMADISSRPKTFPLAPTSSAPARHETVKLTPSDIPPLPASKPGSLRPPPIPPSLPPPLLPTITDEEKPSRAPILLITLLVAALGIGVGAYAAGKRAQQTPAANVAPTFTVVAAPSSAPVPAAAPSESVAAPVVSVSAKPPAPPRARPKARPAPPVVKSAEPPPPEPTTADPPATTD